MNTMTTVDPRECILWDGHTNGRGYPQIYSKGKKRLVSHLIWEEETGRAVPRGMYICHRFDTPECITFDHLFLGTPIDNSRDMIAKGRGRGHFKKTDYCKRGHSLLDPENTITKSRGKRNCRACNGIHFAEYRRRIRENPVKYAERLASGRERQRRHIAAESDEEREARLAKQRSYSMAARSRIAAENPENYQESLAKSRIRSRAQHERLAKEEPEKYQARLARQRELANARYKRKKEEAT